MAGYTGSQAQSGNQTTLGIGATPTLIGEITGFTQAGKQNKSDDTTNLQSSAEEFLPTLLSPGKYTVNLNRVPGDAGQVALLAAFNNKTIAAFTITLQKTAIQTTAGDKYTFNAMVEEFNDLSDVKPDKKITSQASLKVSGPITYTAGT